MSGEILNLSQLPAASQIWDDVVNASSEGWFWAARAMHEYRIAYAEAAGCFIADRSFFYVRDGRVCGIAPLVICREKPDGDITASYMNAPLPWPMIVSDITDHHSVQRVLFDELETRARSANAARLRLILAPPGTGETMAEAFAHVVRARSFIDVSYPSHYVEVSSRTLDLVRERYRRYVRKFSDRYEIMVLAGEAIPRDFARTYMEIHVKDAGFAARPLVTYERQIDAIERSKGFIVTAHNKTAGQIVGALLISVHKGAAYDNSVAVDPAFQHEPVSNLMKWRAIERLNEMDVSHYELGPVAFTPSYLWQPTAKNYGISFFKDGWARGRTKTVWAAEKFYSREAFDRFWNQKRQAVIGHFSI